MTENNYDKLKDAICELVNIAEDATSREVFEILDNAGVDVIDCLDKLSGYEAIGTIEELIANARNKAIDNYMNKLCNHCMQQTNECYKLECPFCTDGCDIVNIAEQLKSTCNKEKCTYTIRKPIEYFDYDAWLQSEAE